MTNTKNTKKPEMKTYVKKLSASQIEKFNKAKAKEHTVKVTVPLDDEHQLEFNVKQYISIQEHIAMMNEIVKLCFQRNDEEVYDTYYPYLFETAVLFSVAKYYTDIKMESFTIENFYEFAQHIDLSTILKNNIESHTPDKYYDIRVEALATCNTHNRELMAKKKAFYTKNEIRNLIDYAIGALVGFQDGKEYLEELTSTEEGKAAFEDFVQDLMNDTNNAEVTD